MPVVLHKDSHSKPVSDSPPHDARVIQRKLAETFAQPLSEPPGTPPLPNPAQSKPAQSKLSAAHGPRIVKIALGLGLLLVFGAKPAWQLLAPSSAEAVFDARLITLRAPIDGVATVRDKDVIIANTRADSGAVESLAREVARLNAEIASAEARRAGIETALEEETATAEAFHTNRAKQLNARLDEQSQREIIAGLALDDAKSKFGRAQKLSANGFVSAAELERLERAVSQAGAEAAALGALRQQTLVERDAIAAGQYVGDGYNDRPSTAQRLDEDRRRLSEVSAEITSKSMQRDETTKALLREHARFGEASTQALTAPQDAQLWEMVVASGEHVQRGQTLARYVDCANPFVLAAVGEGLYNRLRLGQQARFEPSDGGESIEGRVVSLSGQSASDVSYAVAPNNLTRAAFHVAIALPPGAMGCAIGRTGRVTF
jgi:multidrug resistance efflux pump